MSFITRRPNQLWLLVRFADAWLGSSTEERVLLLADPWAFRQFVFGLEAVADQSQRNAVLHLIHPDAFEDIVNQTMKRDIAEGQAEPEEVGENIDRTLAAVRQRLNAQYCVGFSFYDPEVKALWTSDAVRDELTRLLDEPIRRDLPRASGDRRRAGPPGTHPLVYRWCMARTNIDIDDAACATVMLRYGLATKREAVNFALRVLAAEPLDLDGARRMRGSGWEGDLGELRAARVG